MSEGPTRLNATNCTCPSKWRIKKPFITCTRAGAAKKAAGCGGEAKGASLSYLEPFPVNLGPPFVVVLRACMHTLARRVQRECTHARGRVCDGLGPLPACVCMRPRARARAGRRVASGCENASRRRANSIIIFLSPMRRRLCRIFINSAFSNLLLTRSDISRDTYSIF